MKLEKGEKTNQSFNIEKDDVTVVLDGFLEKNKSLSLSIYIYVYNKWNTPHYATKNSRQEPKNWWALEEEYPGFNYER